MGCPACESPIAMTYRGAHPDGRLSVYECRVCGTSIGRRAGVPDQILRRVNL